MAYEKTLCILKPSTYTRRFGIRDRIKRLGFRELDFKEIKFNRFVAEAFYSEHKGKDFFEAHIDHIISDKCFVLILGKEDAIANFRKHLGATDPREAAEGTLRNLYGTDLPRNGFHASDSQTSYIRERSFFFDEKKPLLRS